MPRPNPFCVHCGLPATPSMLHGNTTVEPSFAVAALGVLRNLAAAVAAAAASQKSSKCSSSSRSSVALVSVEKSIDDPIDHPFSS